MLWDSNDGVWVCVGGGVVLFHLVGDLCAFLLEGGDGQAGPLRRVFLADSSCLMSVRLGARV